MCLHATAILECSLWCYSLIAFDDYLRCGLLADGQAKRNLYSTWSSAFVRLKPHGVSFEGSLLYLAFDLTAPRASKISVRVGKDRNKWISAHKLLYCLTVEKIALGVRLDTRSRNNLWLRHSVLECRKRLLIKQRLMANFRTLWVWLSSCLLRMGWPEPNLLCCRGGKGKHFRFEK